MKVIGIEEHWRTDYSFVSDASGGLKRTIKEYLRDNFYGGILAGDFANQESGAVDPSWSLSYNAYLGNRRLPVRQHESRSPIPGPDANQPRRQRESRPPQRRAPAQALTYGTATS
jgi:hypothetical protein